MFKQAPKLDSIVQTVEMKSYVATDRLEKVLQPMVECLAGWCERAESWVSTRIPIHH